MQIKIWIEKTIVKGQDYKLSGDRKLGNALCSPRESTDKADIYKNMREVKTGDIVFHFIDNKEISGVSIVEEEAVESDGIKGTSWDVDTYLVKLKEYTELLNPIGRADIFSSVNAKLLYETRLKSEVFYTKEFKLRQGAYLTPCSIGLAFLFNNLYKKKNNTDLPHFKKMISSMTILDKLKNLRRANGTALNKPILLLSIIKSFDLGEIKRNEIKPTKELKSHFEKTCKDFYNNSKPNFVDPFLRLQNDDGKFWKLSFIDKPINVNNIGSFKKLQEEVDCAILSEELYTLLVDNVKRDELRNFLMKEFVLKDKHIEYSRLKISNLCEALTKSGLQFSKKTVTRFTASLLTKPFVILSGLSGSGKTKLAQSFVEWICEDSKQYCIVPVGADWTNREPLLGYPNALKPDEYIKPDNCVLDVMIRADKDSSRPYFLILDEMNLSHVERYFADFLSVMESKGKISLYAEGSIENGVPASVGLPPNLFIIGTVNIDETTYMFSPKVLDRANVIEFRIDKEEMKNFFTNHKEIDLEQLQGQGASMAQSFLELAERKEFEGKDLKEVYETLLKFFEELKKVGAEFGYRSATEIIRLIHQLGVVNPKLNKDEKLDIAIMQKLLPKLHGSRRKLCPVLITLGRLCVDDSKIKDIEKEIFSLESLDIAFEGVKYPLSLEKIMRMYKGAMENGFASYAEA
ncbi:MAG: McrB family protein [Hyphomicrobiales bacterium]